MKVENNKLIYAAYGSNLLKERLMVYIQGGVFQNREYEGCTDKTPPEDLGWQYVPYRLYFAKHSLRWNNGGVAFLSCEQESDPEHYAVVRLWKISESQFEDINKQEGIWYNTILHIGKKDGFEIKTFTGCWTHELHKPCEEYLNIIKAGLKETTNWDDKKIDDYISKSFNFKQKKNDYI